MVITGMELIQLEDCSDLLNFFPPKLDKVAVQSMGLQRIGHDLATEQQQQ